MMEAAHLGPQGQPCEGPAFPWPMKLLATALMLGLVSQGVPLLGLLPGATGSLGQWLFLGLAGATVLAGYAGLLIGRTGVDATHLRQRGLLTEAVALQDILQLHFLYVPYLSWLFVPRLVVKLRGGRRVVFRSADRRVQQAFARLAFGAETFGDRPAPSGRA